MPAFRSLSFALALVLPLSFASFGCATNTAPDGDGDSDPSANGDTPADSDDSGKGSGDAPSEIPTATAMAALPLSSCMPSSYVLPLTIGDSDPFDVSIDTGSTSIGVASTACSGCNTNPKYTPASSETDKETKATSQYVTGSWSGEVYEGEIALDEKTKATVKFVAIEEQKNFFTRQSCNSDSGGSQGIMGLAPAVDALRGTNGFFDRFMVEAKAPNVFATELCDKGGMLWLGGYDSTYTTAAPQYTPILSKTAYAVNLASIDVDGESVPVATGKYEGSIVDTGTSVFLLASSAYTPLTKALAANEQFKKIIGEGASWFQGATGQSCKKLSKTKAELDDALPPLKMTFGSGKDAITVQALATESYLINYQNLWCPTLTSFEPSGGLPVAAIMGAPLLRSNVVIFDRAKQRIGFASHTPCK